MECCRHSGLEILRIVRVVETFEVKGDAPVDIEMDLLAFHDPPMDTGNEAPVMAEKESAFESLLREAGLLDLMLTDEDFCHYNDDCKVDEGLSLMRVPVSHCHNPRFELILFWVCVHRFGRDLYGGSTRSR